MVSPPRPAGASWSKRIPKANGWYWLRCSELLGRAPLPARVEHCVSCDGEAGINVEVGEWAGDYVDLPPGSRWWPQPIEARDESRWTRTPPSRSGLFLYRSDEDETWRPFTVATVSYGSDEEGAWAEATLHEHGPGGAAIEASPSEFDGEWWPDPLKPPSA